MDTGERAAYFELSRPQMRTQRRRDGTNIAKWGFDVLRRLRLQEVRRGKNSTIRNRRAKAPATDSETHQPNPSRRLQRLDLTEPKSLSTRWSRGSPLLSCALSHKNRAAPRVPGFHRDRAYRHGFDHALAQQAHRLLVTPDLKTGRFRPLRPR